MSSCCLNRFAWRCSRILFFATIAVCCDFTVLPQTSPLYVVSGAVRSDEADTNMVFQAGARIRQASGVRPYNLAVAVVGGTIRIAGGSSAAGSEYDLGGNPTGRELPVIPDVYDAGSDGRFIFGWKWAEAALVRFDLNWSNGVTLFSLPARRFSKAYMGVTFDPATRSVWLAPWDFGGLKGHLANYSLDGRLIRSFATVNTNASGAGLALDPADDTLWFFSWTDGRYEQYSRSGQLLATLTLPGLGRIYGAEFDRTMPARSGRVVAWGDNTRGQIQVPADLSQVISVAAGWRHSLALTMDGRVAAWGAGASNEHAEPNFGQSLLPVTLGQSLQVEAGTFHSIALRSDGTVQAWGGSTPTQTQLFLSAGRFVQVATRVYHSLALREDGVVEAWGDNLFSPPPEATNGIAVAAGYQHDLMLREDGTVLGWGDDFYGQATIPAQATNVVAVACGDNHSVVLRADGTVVAWGPDGVGRSDVPIGLDDVVAVAAGDYHNLALRSDGSVVSWGAAPEPPGDLRRVIGISAGALHDLAIVGDGSPLIVRQPADRHAAPGTTVQISAGAVGDGPLLYQWEFNGAAVPGQTNRVLPLRDVETRHEGFYTLVVTNAVGTARSQPARVSLVLPPPANDLFSARALLEGATVQVNASNRGASAEPGEPPHAGMPASRSVWWTWTAPSTQPYILDTSGSTVITVAEVYTGSGLGTLVQVPSTLELLPEPNAWRASFNAVAGVTYHFAIDSPNGDEGGISLSLTQMPPVLKITSPLQPKSVSAGGTLQLAVAGTSTYPISYLWFRDSVPLREFPGASLSILNVAPSASGLYSVVLSNAAGMITSGPVQVVVSAAPVITAHPTNATLNAGSTLVLSTAAFGVPTLVYQWFKNDQPIPSATSSSYTLSNVQADDGGVYTVLAANFFGATLSSNALVSVNAPSQPQRPFFRRQPSGTNLLEGGTLILAGTLAGQKPMWFQWFKEGAPLDNATNSLLVLNGATANQSGSYTLQASNIAGQATSAAALVRVVPPFPSNDNFAQRVLLAGNEVTWAGTSLGATREPGEPPLRNGHTLWWSWLAGTESVVALDTLNSGIDTVLAVYTGSSLGNLTRLALNDNIGGGTNASALTFTAVPGLEYHVVVDDMTQPGDVALHLKATEIPPAPPMFTQHPTNRSIIAGSRTTLKASAAGSPEIRYLWYRDAVLVAQGPSTELSLTNVQAGDAGVYQVVATNTYGMAASSNAVLTVSPGAPRITSQPIAIQRSEGQPLSVSAQFTGSSPMQIQWFKDNDPIPDATNATIQFGLLRTSQTGSYRFSLANELGTTNSKDVAIQVLPSAPLYEWTTIAGTAGSPGNADGNGPDSRLNTPSGLAIDPEGNLLIADSANNRIRRLYPDGRVATLLGTNGQPLAFSFPVGVAIEAGGTLYVSEISGGRITRVTSDGTRRSVQSAVWYFSLDASGELYWGDTFSRVYRLNADGTRDTLVDQLSSPTDAVFDAAGDLVIANAGAGTVMKVSPAGVRTILAGSASSSGFADGPGSSARFMHPNSVCLDSLGNVFVADEYASTIRKISPEGFVTTIGGLGGVSGSSDGVSGDSRFNGPRQVRAGADGTLYVVDTGNNTIRKGTPILPSPELGFSWKPDGLTLTWPATIPRSRLQWTETLEPGGWVDLPGSPLLRDGSHVMNIDASRRRAYFRLVR